PAGFDRPIRVWDLERRAVLHPLAGPRDKVLSLAYRPDGQLLASAGLDGTIRLYNPVNGRRRALLRTRELAIQGLAFTPDGRCLLAAGESGRVGGWEVAGRRLARSFPVAGAPPSPPALPPPP